MRTLYIFLIILGIFIAAMIITSISYKLTGTDKEKEGKAKTGASFMMRSLTLCVFAWLIFTVIYFRKKVSRFYVE